MIQIRPVSDLRNKFPEIERIVKTGQPVYLTKNGYGAMVVMDLERYEYLTDDTDYIEAKLDEADEYAASTTKRLTLDEAFEGLIDSGETSV
jgi:prevent-host-death family protein